MSVNKEFYEEYYDGLTWKVHFMRWFTGVAFILPIAILWIALYFGGKIALGITLGLLFLVGFPYLLGGGLYDMRQMDKAGVYYK